MNKKLFLGMFAAAGMLLATSCSNDELDVVQSGNEAQVTFSLAAEGGIATRAISDGTGAKKLVYAVYNAEGDLIRTIANADMNGQIVDNSAFDNGLTENVTITLAKGQQYTVAFWAQNPNCTAYTATDLKNVTVDYAGLNNDETRDAFFKAEKFTVTGDATINVVLTRPFAQINVGVTKEDWEAANASGITIEKSSVVIKNAAKSINLLTGEVGAETTDVSVNYTANNIPQGEMLKVDTDGDGEDEEYHWLSMSYILVADHNDTPENGLLGTKRATLQGLQYTFTPTSGQPITFEEGLAGAPVRRNWRTNILGKLLTGDVQFNITIDPAYNGDIIYPSELEEELELAATFGGTVKLTAPVTLTAPLNVTANMVIDLNGHTISGAFAKADNAENAMIQNNANLTIVGGTIKNETYNGDAAILNNGNLILDGATITGAPLADGGYSAYAVISSGKLTINKGTVVTADRGCLKLSGAGETVINGGTFTNNDIGSRDLTSHVVDVEDGGTHKLTINGGTFKHLHTSTSGGVVICNRTTGTVYVNGGSFSGGNYYVWDNLADYGYGGTFSVKGGTYSEKPADNYLADGYKAVQNGSNFVVVSNDIDAVVSSATELSDAISDGATTINLTEGDYVIPSSAQGKTLTIKGTGTPEDVKVAVTTTGSGENCDFGLAGSTVTFEGITITTNSSDYIGYAHCKGTYKNCVINGQYTLYGDSNFENCTFNVDGNFYNIWTWGAPNAKFDKCTFNSDGKAMLLYGTVNTNLTIENSVFNDKGGLTDLKAAIEIGNDYGTSYTLVVNNTVVNGYEINNNGINTGTTLWANKNSMGQDKLSVTVDGARVY